MSVTAIASLRPLRGQCIRQATTGLLSVHVKSRTGSFGIQALVALRPHQQKRFQSGSKESDTTENNREVRSKPKLTSRQFLGRAITVSLRNLGYVLSPKGFRETFRQNLYMNCFLLALVAFIGVIGTIEVRKFYKTFYNPEFSRYPEPVANTLRRAIYYTIIRPDGQRAVDLYKLALLQAREIGMEFWSDEVLGIRIMCAFTLEKIYRFRESIDLLEAIHKGCLDQAMSVEQQVKDGLVDDRGYLAAAPEPVQAVSAKSGSESESEDKPEPETLWHQRERLLKKAISISVKLGELYADEHILDQDNAHRHLVWSVETTLKEFRRRREEGPKPGEESWLSPSEMGASFESLGRDYERKSLFHLAIPLFFQALRNCDVPCHRAVIMNNLAACFAQHPIYNPPTSGSPELETLKDLFASSMPHSRKDCWEAAANWARNAYAHAKDVKGDDRTPECDEACAVALCNWGDVAGMQGKPDLARRKYSQAIEMSRKLDFTAGVEQAQAGLKKLDQPPSRRKQI